MLGALPLPATPQSVKMRLHLFGLLVNRTVNDMKLATPALLALTLALAPTAQAQITVTNATFPAAGDTLRMAVDYAPAAGSVVLGPPGFFVTWDFSGLQVDATQSTIYRAAGAVPGAELLATTALNMPPATITWPDTGIHDEHYDVTGSEFRLQAVYGANFDLMGNTLIGLTPPLNLRRAPMNFFDITQYTSGAIALYDQPALSPVLTAAFPFSAADSVRYRITYNVTATVDAFGTLTIPGGSFEVLREKRTQYREVRMDAKINPLGWLDVTDQAIPLGARGLGVTTTIYYSFYNDTVKEPIAVVNTGDDGLVPLEVSFRHAPPGPPAGVAMLPTAPARLAQNEPNQFNPRTTIRFELERAGWVRCGVYDLRGRLVATLVDAQMEKGGHWVEWDGRGDGDLEVSSGVYLYRLEGEGWGVERKMVLAK